MRTRARARSLLVLSSVLAACTAPTTDDLDPTGPVGGGRAQLVTWTRGDDVYALDVDSGLERNISTELVRDSRSSDRWLVPSAGGAFFALGADLGGGDGEVLVRASVDLTDVEIVRPGGAPVYLEGLPAITDDGTVVFFAASGGPHALDLWRSERGNDGTWSAPTLLTSSSTAAFNNQPSLTRDEARLLFNCGAERDPESGDNAACSVDVGGGSVDVLVAPDTLSNGRNTFVNFPRDAGDHIVFEGSWPQGDGEPPETLWQRHNDDAPTPAVARTFDNTVSPCVLGNGDIVGLWLGREGSGGAHELTLLHADTDTSFTTLAAVDVSDIGIGCTTRVVDKTDSASNE